MATAPATTRRQEVPAAHAPGATNRRSAKVLDSGARIEDAVITSLAESHGIDAWRLPGVRVPRPSDENYLPDGGGYMPELVGLVNEQEPQVEDRPGYNVLFEVKGQLATGSTKHKIVGAIVDLAHASDVLGVPAVMILHTPVLSEQQIRTYKVEGKLHSVVVLTAEEVTHDLIVSETRRVALERRRLLRRIGPRGGYTPTARPPAYERGLAMRITQRHHAGRRLLEYGAAAR